MAAARSPSIPDVARAREHEQRLISQLTLKRNSVLLQLHASPRGSLGGQDGDLESSRRALEQLAQELERHLEAVARAADRRREAEGTLPPPKGRRSKRPAPSPPQLSRISSVGSAPHLAASSRSPSTERPSTRRRLKKSLSLSGSRSLLATVLATLRPRLRPSLRRTSVSHESLQDLAPLDLDQRLANDTAMRAKERRGTPRSHSAEPRSLPPPVPGRVSRESAPRPGRLLQPPAGGARRPAHLPLGPAPPGEQGRRRFAPSPVRSRVLTPYEMGVSPDPGGSWGQGTGGYWVQGVSEEALREIRDFEVRIARFLVNNTAELAAPRTESAVERPQEKLV